MNKILKCFEDTTSIVNFDVRAGGMVDGSKKLADLIEEIKVSIANGESGCCLHSSLILADKLKQEGIKSGLILTAEPYEINGEIINGTRASVVYQSEEDDKFYVANPVEDAEIFTLLGIDRALRYARYNQDGTLRIPKSILGSEYSLNASKISLADFIERYGEGQARIIYDALADTNKSLNDLVKESILVTSNSFDKKMIKR